MGCVHGIRRGYTGKHIPEVEEEIDLALAVLCVIAQGRRMTIYDNARATGLSHGGVAWLEKNALRKIRTGLMDALRELRA